MAIVATTLIVVVSVGVFSCSIRKARGADVTRLCIANYDTAAGTPSCSDSGWLPVSLTALSNVATAVLQNRQSQLANLQCLNAKRLGDLRAAVRCGDTRCGDSWHDDADSCVRYRREFEHRSYQSRHRRTWREVLQWHIGGSDDDSDRRDSTGNGTRLQPTGGLTMPDNNSNPTTFDPLKEVLGIIGQAQDLQRGLEALRRLLISNQQFGNVSDYSFALQRFSCLTDKPKRGACGICERG
jgi:hypothetical protein